MRTRSPAVAGLFYPADPAALGAAVADYLRAARPADGDPPKALIAPHAGYIYSGPIAGSAYATWRPLRGAVERVVLLGPAHRVPVRGLAAPTVDAFDTPLGPVRIDRAALDAVADLPCVTFDDRPHAREHALEVHLPFIRATLGDVALAPFVVGDARPAEVAAVLDRLWGDDTTRIVISSDLSHYHDHPTATRLDRATVTAIEHLDGDALGHDSACGRIPIRGLLALAPKRALTLRAIDVRTSGDTAGDRDRVVGYAALTVHQGSHR